MNRLALAASPALPAGCSVQDEAAQGSAVIDVAPSRVLRGVSDPEQVAVSPDGRLLYVASEDIGQAIVNGANGGVWAKLAVGIEPEGVAAVARL